MVVPRYSFDRPGDCWQRTSDDGIGALMCQTNVRLAPGESWSNELALWATNGGPCMPTGTFDFETRLSFLEENPTHEFSLRVEEA